VAFVRLALFPFVLAEGELVVTQMPAVLRGLSPPRRSSVDA